MCSWSRRIKTRCTSNCARLLKIAITALPNPLPTRRWRRDTGASSAGATRWIQHPDWLDYFNQGGKWFQLNSVLRVERERQMSDKTEHSVHYYISSLTAPVTRIARCIRSHWGIENRVHWLLDVVFQEDLSRVRVGFGAENFAVLRHIALNLLKREQSVKRSIQRKRFLANMDHDYLLKVLHAGLP